MTAQMSETLIYKGEKLNLCTNPLEIYLSSVPPAVAFCSTCTALWRGYTGTWTIEGGRLYLVKLAGTVRRAEVIEDVGLSHLFPDYPDGVFAHWYSGEIRCPMGEMLKYVHGGYGCSFEQDLFIEIKNGVVIHERVVSNGEGSGKGGSGYVIGAMTTFGKD